MKHRSTTAQSGRSRPGRVGRWLQPRRLAMVAASGLALGGGLFGVLSHTLVANATNFTVDTTLDLHVTPSNSTTCNTAGTCSLRAAIEASNNAGGTNTITVPSGTYNLTLGELQVAPSGGQSLTINGAGMASTTIHALQPPTCTSSATSTCFRVFNIDPATNGGTNITLTGVTVSGGRTAQFGGAGLISGVLDSVHTPDNTTITNSTFSDNVIYGPATTTPGGAISQVYGAVTVSGSTFTNNSAGASVGGAIDQETLGGGSPTLSVSSSTFTGNSAAGGGGAVKFAGTATSPAASITGSSFGTNSTTASGGAVEQGGAGSLSISTSSFTGNTGGRGGAVKNTGGTMTVTSDTFTGNTATNSDGGALANAGTITVTGSTFTGNSATGSGTNAGHGGAIFNDQAGVLTMHYSRLYNNTATTANQAYFVPSGPGSANATNDWWGVNAGPTTAASSNITVSPWQILTSTASPSTILVNQTSTITADLDHTNTSATIAPSHHLPDGIPVTFANGALGTVNSTSGTLSSGATSTTYTAGATGGVDGVPTTIDGQTVNASITVDQPPHITSANHATFVAGSAGSFQVTAAGYPAPTFSETGTLPNGVTLSSGGLLSGTPATGTGGVYTFTITATNGVTPDDTQSFTLTVNEAPHITSANNTTFTVGSPGTFTITSRGYPAPSITLTSGSLPGGVTYDAPTHVLSGTPNAGTGGQYSLQFTSHNGIGSDSVQAFTLTVNEPASITSANGTVFTVGTPGSFSVLTGGFPHSTLSDGGATLPTGVTFVDNLDGTATLSGNPGSGQGGTYPFTITAHNGIGTDATQPFTLTVDEAVSVTSANNTTFTTGTPGTFSVTTLGFPKPTLSDGGATLPTGVTFVDNGNGTATLAGTPAAGQGGTYPFTITANNSLGSQGTQSFTLTVDQPPAITSANATTFTVGSPGTFTVRTTGVPAPSLSDGGATLPTGVTFHDNGDGTATLAGTPGAGQGGTYPFTITASNGVGSNATQGFTLTVDQAAAVTSANSTTFTVGAPGTFTVTTSGVPTPTLSDGAATLPSGVTFHDNGDGTATLAGTPAAGTGGTYPFTITATNGIGSPGTQSFTLTVNQAPAIASANATTFNIGTPNTFSVTTSGFPSGASMVITETGTLPTGVTFTDNGNGTGTLSGNPGSTTAGSYPITFGANNGVAPAASQNFTLTVAGAPHITSANHTTFVVGSAGTFTVTATGSTPMTISETGSLPSGVTLTNNNDGTATLAGTPAAGTAGTYPLSITAHNSQTPDDVQSFTLQVNAAPAITSANNTTFTVGAAGTFTVTSTGTPTPALTESGALPSGVTFADNANGTGTLSGTPGAGTGGVYHISFKAANGVGSDATQPFTLTIDQAPAITSASTATFTVGTAGSFNVTTTGFPHAAITEPDTMPTGLTFLDNNDGTATISGTPGTGTGGTYNIHLTANNGVSPNATQTLVLTVDEAAGITSANNTTFTVGTLGSFDVTTSGFPPAAISETGALPSGVTLVDNHNGTATLSGTPAGGTGGVYPITIRAHNGVGSDATQAFTLTVDEAPSITSANNTTFTVGSAGTFTVTTGGYPKPGLGESGTLPTGVTFTDNNDGTGTLSGTPATGTGGVYPISFTASNGVGSPAPQIFTLTVNEAAAVTSANSTTFAVGTAGSFGVTTRGYPHPSLSDGGATLPTGVSFTDNGDGTATLAGTPATGTGGVYTFTITAHNGIGGDGTQSFTLTVNEAPAITSASSTTFTAGSAGTFTVTTRGFPHPAITETGTLPSGVSFLDNGDGTATLSGTPATGTGGVYPISFKAHNTSGPDATQSFTLTINEAAAVTSANNTTFTVGASGSFGVTTRGYPAPSLGETGTLPSGVTFADNHDGTATLSGTPATGTGGVYPITITAHNGVGSDGTQSFTLTVDEASAFTSANHTTFTTGQAGNFPITTRGYPHPSIGESGALPGGVTLTDNGDGTAKISGTPNAGIGGTYPITLTAHNGVGTDGTQSFTLTVDQPAAITSANNTTFTAGSANSFAVTTSGFPAPSLTETGTLPSGVSFTDNGNGTGTLSGNPATGTGGVYHISFKAHNGVGGDATQSFTLTVNEAAAITSADHTQFQVGASGTFTVTTRGYPIPSLGESGALPSGVTFTDNHDGTGTLAGTPATGTAGTYHITFTAHNGVGSDGTQAFTLQVGPAPTTTTVTASTTSPTFGSPDTFTATVAPQPPSSGTPAGTVTFAVDGTNTAVVTLVNGQAQWTTSSLQQGAHTISAAYSGQTNTFQPSTGSIDVNTGCAVVYNTRIAGSLTISGGSACINGARISGGVSVSGGASVSIVNSTIGSGLTSNGAHLLTVCLSSVGSSMQVSNSTGFVLIGSNGDDTAMPCAGNSINGGVTLNGNTGGLEVGGNPSIKGAVTVNNNVLAGSAVDAENGAPEIEHNSIKGSLSCSGNAPAPINDGAPNTVSGARAGQCGAPGF
ncbi:MAG TPA: putative Ig domain-containing protein [Candidatus Angelobacter sp.]|jgi:hypothetical protein|nr:putative Ig domain-containing protein [Candidatus Angelobacter sp.]